MNVFDFDFVFQSSEATRQAEVLEKENKHLKEDVSKPSNSDLKKNTKWNVLVDVCSCN